MDMSESGAPAESASDKDDSASTSTALVLRAPDTARPNSVLRTAAAPLYAATGVARVAVSAAVEAGAWGVRTAVDVTSVVLRGSVAGQPPREILSEAGAQVRDSVRQVLGVHAPETVVIAPEPNAAAALRARGAELLRRSAEIHVEHDNHHYTAYARILGELAPDEARIVRHLYLDGPQPAVEIRAGRTAARGVFTLLGEDAALRYPNRIDEYLVNLDRLCLLDVTREAMGNPNRYQLLEALPDVRRLLKRTTFGSKVAYRTVELTSFGAGFVRTCLPVPVLDSKIQHG